MLDFESWIARHGECGVQAMIESAGRRERISLKEGCSLEERWQAAIERPAVTGLQGAA